VIRRRVEVQFLVDSDRIVEPGFGVTETLVEFGAEEYQCDLHPLGEPAIAIRRSGFVWIIYMLFGKILTLPYQRSFGLHIA